jgi:hypothetical protein
MQYFAKDQFETFFGKKKPVSKTEAQKYGVLQLFSQSVIDLINKEIKPGMLTLLDTYAPMKNFVVLFHTSSGYAVSMQFSLYPDYKTCKQQASNYDSMDQMLINLDRN